MTEQYHLNKTAEGLADTTPERLPVDALDYVLYPLFYIAYISVLSFFDVVQRIALLFGKKAHNRSVDWLNWSGFNTMKIIGVDVEIKGNRLPEGEGPFIIVSNHQSIHDIPTLYVTFDKHRPRYVAKKELGRNLPGISLNLRAGGSALIDRSDTRQAIRELKELGQRMMEQRFSTVIFPEGTRAREGAMKPFKLIGLKTLIESCPDARILPVAIDNSWRLAPAKFGQPVPRGTTIKLAIGNPLDRKDFSSSKELLRTTEKSVHELLASLRANP